MKKKVNVNKLIKYVGTIITLVAIFFVFKKLLSSDIDYSLLFNKKNILPVMLAILVQGIIVITNCFPWRKLVELLTNKQLPFKETVLVYAKSNLLKYAPGNVFQYVGRNELAVRRSLSHVEVATATAIDVFMTVLAAFVISMVFLSSYIFEFLRAHQDLVIIALIVMLVLIVLVAMLIVFFRRRVLIYFKKYKYLLAPKSLKVLLFCLFYYVVVMMLSSLMYMLVLRYVLDFHMTPVLFVNIFSAYTLSWLVGFITPGAPAGIGIKEAVMVGVTGGLIDVSIVTLSMVVFRVLSTLADLLGFGIALGLQKILKDEKLEEIV